jgi:hypothetical protein
VAQIVSQGNGFGEVFLQSNLAGYNPADLCNFQRMGESGSVVIIGW